MKKRAVRILEQLERNRAVIECAFCAGRGTMSGFEAHVACRVCNGRGRLKIESQIPLISCEHCGENGSAPGAEWHVVCSYCHGSGIQGFGGEQVAYRSKSVEE